MFQPKYEGKISCPDFTPAFLDKEYCKLSSKCKKDGYWIESNTLLCTGIKRAPRPRPLIPPPKKERFQFIP